MRKPYILRLSFLIKHKPSSIICWDVALFNLPAASIHDQDSRPEDGSKKHL
jgi:hypothetical protein